MQDVYNDSITKERYIISKISFIYLKYSYITNTITFTQHGFIVFQNLFSFLKTDKILV